MIIDTSIDTSKVLEETSIPTATSILAEPTITPDIKIETPPEMHVIYYDNAKPQITFTGKWKGSKVAIMQRFIPKAYNRYKQELSKQVKDKEI